MAIKPEILQMVAHYYKEGLSETKIAEQVAKDTKKKMTRGRVNYIVRIKNLKRKPIKYKIYDKIILHSTLK